MINTIIRKPYADFRDGCFNGLIFEEKPMILKPAK
jgi:hypothetical protein